MPGSSIQTSNRTRKRNQTLENMSVVSGQQFEQGETESQRIYKRISMERKEFREKQRERFQVTNKMIDNFKTNQAKTEQGDGSQQNLSQRRILTSKGSEAQLVSQKSQRFSNFDLGETSGDDDDNGGFNIDEFFEPEPKKEPLRASDGRIIFSYSSAFIKYWNYAVIVLAIYNSITIPISIFYAEDGHSMFRGALSGFMDAIVDLIFLVDVIVTFRTTYLDTTKGCEETDTHKIGMTYLRGSFTIDFASSVPFAEFVPTALKSAVKLLGLLKLLRISRLSVAVTSSNAAQADKVQMKIVIMAFELLVVMHVLGTIWFALVGQSQRWVQNMDFMYNYQDQAYQGYFEGDENFWRKHLVMMYTAFYVFTVGEIVPRSTTNEFAISFLLESVCTIVNAIIIGYMTSYMDELSKKSAELSTKINLTNTAMINLALARPLKTEISKYIYNTHTTNNLQNDMSKFLQQLKPSLEQKVVTTSFVSVVDTNYVMRNLLKSRTEQIFSMSLSMQKTQIKNSKRKFQEKLITILVAQFSNVFTAPDTVFLKFDDAPTANPAAEEGDDDGDDDGEEKLQSFMYFIRTGQFEVTIKSSVVKSSNPNKKKVEKRKQLYDGDHFGEIGLLYDSKRTATVKSQNYGSLAKLTKSGFDTLKKQFPNLETEFKQYIFKYKDDLRTFLEMECDKIPYFNALSMITKQELLFSMERRTYNEGDNIFEEKGVIDKLIVIESGVVQLAVEYDKRRPSEKFVIERLTSGAILNHQAFLVKDKADTTFICRTPVSCFELPKSRMMDVISRRPDIRQARLDIKMDLMQPLQPVALDYIFHNNAENPEQYMDNLHRNAQKVKLKNVIMQVWTMVKQEMEPKNFKTLLNEMKERFKQKQRDLGLDKDVGAGEEKTEEQMLEIDSKTSYFTLDQYNMLNKRITEAHYRMKEQQTLVDKLDGNMSQIINKIRERKRRHGSNSGLSSQRK